MKTFVQNFDIGLLTGRELIQVCVGLYQAILVFDAQIQITLECEFAVRSPARPMNLPCPVQDHAGELLPLLGSKITASRILEGGHLQLEFSNGWALHIRNNNDQYESYQITSPNATIVV